MESFETQSLSQQIGAEGGLESETAVVRHFFEVFKLSEPSRGFQAAIGTCQMVCFSSTKIDEGSHGERRLFHYYGLHNRCGSGYPTTASRSADVSSTQ